MKTEWGPALGAVPSPSSSPAPSTLHTGDRRPASAAFPVPDEPPAPDGAALADMAERLNLAARTLRTSLEFAVREDTNQLVIQVIDTQTGQVIRSIPPDQVVKAHDMMQSLVGLLMDVRI